MILKKLCSLLIFFPVFSLAVDGMNYQDSGAKEPFELPKFLPKATIDSEKEFNLPKPTPSQLQKTSSGQSFLLKDINFSGNSIFSKQQLIGHIEEFINRQVTLADLEEVRLRLTQFYIQAGYVNSGLIIPKQNASAGVINYQVIEGRLIDINIRGNERLNKNYISDRLWYKQGDILNTQDLQKRFQLLLSDPLIERLNGSLKPSTKLGESILDLDVKRAKALSVNLAFDNYRTPSTGAEGFILSSTIYNPAGYGDRLNLYYGQTTGTADIDISYFFPLNAQDTRFLFDIGTTRSSVVEQPLKEAGIRSLYRYIELGISHPLKNSLMEKLTIDMRFVHKQSQTFLLDQGSQFSLGDKADGRSRISLIHLGQDYSLRQSNQVLALRSVFNIGLDLLNSTINPTQADSRFISWLGQGQYAYRFANLPGQLMLRGNIQLSNKQLLSMQWFAIGGIYSIRGYRENAYVSDNGFWGSIEYQLPILGEQLANYKGVLHLSPFFDIGSSWKKGYFADKRNLSSMGFALKWQAAKFYAQLTLAYGFKQLDNPNSYNLQDDGINFKLSFDL